MSYPMGPTHIYLLPSHRSLDSAAKILRFVSSEQKYHCEDVFNFNIKVMLFLFLNVPSEHISLNQV